ncbi:MAG: hypothetical protein V4506_04415 [Bacteroidota bacterium]
MENTETPQTPPQCCFKTCRNAEEAQAVQTIKSFQQKEPKTDTSKNVFGIFEDMLFYY